MFSQRNNKLNFHLISFTLFTILIQPCFGAIKWQGNWAFACDFKGNDLTEELSKGEECGGLCERHPNCTHFTHSSGTCQLKQGLVYKTDAVESANPSTVTQVCGVGSRSPAFTQPDTTTQSPVKIATTTRYWDCCKPSCAWSGKANTTFPVQTCAKNGVTPTGSPDTMSACDGGPAFTCNDNVPWSVDPALAYGFAGAYITGLDETDWCCACYKLNFTSSPLMGKSMIVQVTNTFGSMPVSNFNLQLPGSGMGTHDGCTTQWNTTRAIWGETYGGLGSRLGCAGLPEAIREGCYFRFDWLLGADNPGVSFTEVPCPEELEKRSQCVRLDRNWTKAAVLPSEGTGSVSKGTNNSIIIGVTVPFVLLVCTSLGVGLWFKNRRQSDASKARKFGRMRHSRAYSGDNLIMHTHGRKLGLLGQKGSFPAIAQYVRLLDVPRDSLEISETILGRGHYGLVYKALAHKLPTVPRGPTTVAVKVLCNDMDREAELQFAAEFRVMLKAGRHINVINILGIVQDYKPMLILEYCKFGSLLAYVKSHRTCRMYTHLDVDGNLLPYSKDEKAQQQSGVLGLDYRALSSDDILSTSDLIRFAHQISRGMAYLSSRAIIHRDLAARNILVTEQKILKISDFGLARHGDEFYTASNAFLALPVLWMPPEAIITRQFSQKSDVWSFGVTMWEIFSLGETPFDGSDVVKFSAAAFAEWLAAGNQMPRTRDTPLLIYQLMQACWSVEPTDRPTFSSLWDSLDKTVDEMSSPDLGGYLCLLEGTSPSNLDEKLAELSEQILLIPEDAN